MRKFVCAAGVAFAAAVFLGACGGGGSSSASAMSTPEEVRAVVGEADEAVLNKNAEQFCALISTSFEERVKIQTGASSCESALEPLLEKLPDEQVKQDEQQLHELVATKVKVTGDRATMSFPEEFFVLIRSGGRWLLDESHEQQGGEAEAAAEEASAEPTKAEWVAAADDICKRGDEALKPLEEEAESLGGRRAEEDPEGTFHKLAEFVEELPRIAEPLYEELRAIPVAESQKQIVFKILGAIESRTSYVPRLVEALKEEDLAKVEEITSEADASKERVKGLEQGYGLKVCGEDE